MTKKTRDSQQVPDETAELKSRLEQAEETLRAVRQYLIDAFVVTRSGSTEIITLQNADFPYRMMVESMNEGAVTVIPDGTIFYCNPRFAEMLQTDSEKLVGISFQDLIVQDEQSAFETIFKQAEHNGTRAEFHLQAIDGTCLPVQLSISLLAMDDTAGISILATDISERVQAEENIRFLASKLTMAEQNERHRISQILHDDLQQRLYAIKTRFFMMNDATGENKLSTVTQADLNQIQSWLSDAVNITRNLSIDLSPVVLQEEGLTEAIAWLSSQMEEQYGLQVKLEAKDNFHGLEIHMRVLLFQAMRELLFNIVKYAGTSQAAIILEQINGHIRITVSDSGKGFDVEAIMKDPKAAHGLLIIKDRLGLMGGSMEVISKPNEGTLVVIEIPRGGPIV
jgi:PAS domain S-box-containing protein